MLNVMIACLVYMTFHTRSIFLAVSSLLNILMSLPISMCIYSYIFRVTYFSSIHISIIIIIIGIGSDDIFVFHDAWKGSSEIKAISNKPILRLSYCYRYAAKSMLVTSLTSSVAFLSCTLSNIMPIRSFGVFATIVVLVCYILTIHVQPIIYYIYERHIQGKDLSLDEESIESLEFSNFTQSEESFI